MKQIFSLLILTVTLPLTAQAVQITSLSASEYRDGISALPYYQSINSAPLQTHRQAPQPEPAYALGFPSRSQRLIPGSVQEYARNAPGLRPYLLIGDHKPSRQWLVSRSEIPHCPSVAGLAVIITDDERLAAIRNWCLGMAISRDFGDDLAARLGLFQYAVLNPTITLK